MTPADLNVLTYDQRKALRRISRGQSISRHVSQDPLIAKCYTTPAPSKPLSEMDIIDYCDWEARLMSGHPVITEYGKQLFAQLETPTDRKDMT